MPHVLRVSLPVKPLIYRTFPPSTNLKNTTFSKKKFAFAQIARKDRNVDGNMGNGGGKFWGKFWGRRKCEFIVLS